MPTASSPAPARERPAISGRAGRLGVALVALAVAAVPTALFVANTAGLVRAQAWQRVSATIVSSGYETSTHRETRWHGDPGVGATRTVTTTTLDTVVFVFTVRGRQYESSRPSFFQRWTLGKNSPRYAEGRELAAFYDPEAAGEAVLARGVDSGFFVCLGVTLYAWLLFFAVLLVLRRAPKAGETLGGLLIALPGLVIILGALVASTAHPLGHFVALGAFGGLPIYLGFSLVAARWWKVPGWVSGLVMVGAFIALIAALIASGN